MKKLLLLTVIMLASCSDIVLPNYGNFLVTFKCESQMKGFTNVNKWIETEYYEGVDEYKIVLNSSSKSDEYFTTTRQWVKTEKVKKLNRESGSIEKIYN
jgi:hypothetical protein